MTDQHDERLERLLGPSGEEVGCEECFDRLDEFVELELGGVDADAAVPGLRAHLRAARHAGRSTTPCSRWWRARISPRRGKERRAWVADGHDGFLKPRDPSPLSASGTMHVVGMIEIVAGLSVAIKPRYGAYLVAAWLGGIVVNLLTYSGYYDIALRDFGLMLGALTLARLASKYDPR